MDRKLAVGITHSKPTFDTVVTYFVEMNPTFPFSLIAVKDRFDTPVPATCDRVLRGTWILREKEDILHHLKTKRLRDVARMLLPYMHNNSTWKNMAILTALSKGFDTLIIWDDDQYPLPLDGVPNWCQPFYDILQSGFDVVEARGYGYQHPIPINIIDYVPEDVLFALEDALNMCYEAATPHLFTNPVEVFLPYPGTVEEYRVPDRFHTLQLVCGGSIGLNLKSQLPMFYQPPGNISRGNDVFFSCAFRSMKKKKLANSYLHDGRAIYDWNPVRAWTKVAATPATKADALETFFRVIQGWLSYAPLLLRLEFPETFRGKIRAINAGLQSLSAPYHVFSEQFDSYCERLNLDLRDYYRANELWRELLSEMRA